GQHLEIVDALTGDKVLTRLYDRKAGVTEVAPGWVAVMDPSGRAELVDVLTSKVQFEQQLAPEPGLESLHVVRDGELLYWGINTVAPANRAGPGHVAVAGAALVPGHLYALDAATGEPRWSRPATIDGFGIAPLQAPAAPVLLLVSRYRKGPEATATESTR